MIIIGGCRSLSCWRQYNEISPSTPAPREIITPPVFTLKAESNRKTRCVSIFCTLYRIHKKLHGIQPNCLKFIIRYLVAKYLHNKHHILERLTPKVLQCRGIFCKLLQMKVMQIYFIMKSILRYNTNINYT